MRAIAGHGFTREALVRRLRVALAALALCIAGTSAFAQATAPIRVGSKADNEGALLGQIVLLLLRHAGLPVVDRSQLGPTAIVRRALLSGELDVYPEYTGNAAFFFHRENDPAFRRADSAYAAARALDRAANELVWLAPAPADNHWAIAVRRDLAARARLRTLADLARYVQTGGALRLAGSAEFVESPAALPVFERAYGFRLSHEHLLVLAGGDTSATIKAAAEHLSGVDASMVYATDGALAVTGLTVLEDPRHVELAYQPAPVIRAATLARYPQIEALLAPAFAALDLDTLRRLNARTQIDGEDAATVARDFLRERRLLE